MWDNQRAFPYYLCLFVLRLLCVIKVILTIKYAHFNSLNTFTNCQAHDNFGDAAKNIFERKLLHVFLPNVCKNKLPIDNKCSQLLAW